MIVRNSHRNVNAAQKSENEALNYCYQESEEHQHGGENDIAQSGENSKQSVVTVDIPYETQTK